MNPEKIQAEIEALQRSPFREILGQYLECGPSKAAIKEFAEAFPDRYAKAIQSLAILSGYNETVTHEHNYLVEIRNLSDAQIMHRLQELDQEPIEGEIVTPLVDEDNSLLEGDPVGQETT